MGPCVILSPVSCLEPGVGSVETINLCGVSFCIKFFSLSCLEPGAGSININIIGCGQLGVETHNK